MHMGLSSARRLHHVEHYIWKKKNQVSHLYDWVRAHLEHQQKENIGKISNSRFNTHIKELQMKQMANVNNSFIKWLFRVNAG